MLLISVFILVLSIREADIIIHASELIGQEVHYLPQKRSHSLLHPFQLSLKNATNSREQINYAPNDQKTSRSDLDTLEFALRPSSLEI